MNWHQPPVASGRQRGRSHDNRSRSKGIAAKHPNHCGFEPAIVHTKLGDTRRAQMRDIVRVMIDVDEEQEAARSEHAEHLIEYARAIIRPGEIVDDPM